MNRGISKPLVRRVGAAKVCTYPLTWVFKISELWCEFAAVPIDLRKKLFTAGGGGLNVSGSSLAGAIYLFFLPFLPFFFDALHLPSQPTQNPALANARVRRVGAEKLVP